MSTIDSCGGCLYGDDAAGQDCTDIDNAVDVACLYGKCKISELASQHTEEILTARLVYNRLGPNRQWHRLYPGKDEVAHVVRAWRYFCTQSPLFLGFLKDNALRFLLLYGSKRFKNTSVCGHVRGSILSSDRPPTCSPL
jgi:hypothetical protein